jgi:hypothetical protein
MQEMPNAIEPMNSAKVTSASQSDTGSSVIKATGGKKPLPIEPAIGRAAGIGESVGNAALLCSQ